MLESSFKERVRKDLVKVPGLFTFSMMPGSLAGLPDRIICYKGRFIAWEIKKSEAECKSERQGHALQRWIIQKICDAGGIGRFVYPENYQKMMEEILSLE